MISDTPAIREVRPAPARLRSIKDALGVYLSDPEDDKLASIYRHLVAELAIAEAADCNLLASILAPRLRSVEAEVLASLAYAIDQEKCRRNALIGLETD